ncbi:MAG: hypothetical protein M1826_000605 [Phylliscum demangeonii]|nr:MAG: hypothetical protein M1826_000605 [Phylliscum demangeonii]
MSGQHSTYDHGHLADDPGQHSTFDHGHLADDPGQHSTYDHGHLADDPGQDPLPSATSERDVVVYPGLPSLEEHLGLPSHPAGQSSDDFELGTQQEDLVFAAFGDDHYEDDTINRGRPAKAFAPARAASPGPPRTQARVAKPKKSKKAPVRGSKKEKAKVPDITAPLSEITKDLHHIPVKDMEPLIHRSAEVRWKETAERKGYVTRPMNSFMLYRSAYTERAKVWSLQNNHQVISALCGQSWALEPAEVRDKYIAWGLLEQNNHRKAHPGYKFKPTKANAKKRKKGAGDDESAASDAETPDDDWDNTSGRTSRNRGVKRAHSGESDSTYGSSPAGLRARPYQPRHDSFQSPYAAAYPARSVPNPADGQEFYDPQFAAGMYQNWGNQYAAPAGLHRTETATSHQSEYPTVVGLPGANHRDLYSQASSANTPAAADDHLVDPALLGNHQHGSSAAHLNQAPMAAYGGMVPDQSLEDTTTAAYGDFDVDYSLGATFAHYAGMPTLDGAQAPADRRASQQESLDQSEQWGGKAETVSEFVTWYNQNA